jgi:hypothetical protein
VSVAEPLRGPGRGGGRCRWPCCARHGYGVTMTEISAGLRGTPRGYRTYVRAVGDVWHGGEATMTRSSGDEVGKVIPLRRRHRPHPSLALKHDMVDATRSFHVLEDCIATLHSGQLMVAPGTDTSEWPIVSFQVQLPVTRRWLNQLGRINITNWPDARWALRLEDAHADAELYLDAVTKSLCTTPPGTGPPNGRLAMDIRQLADALYELRQVIAQQFPEVLRSP